MFVYTELPVLVNLSVHPIKQIRNGRIANGSRQTGRQADAEWGLHAYRIDAIGSALSQESGAAPR
jgi:hypothetical protein